MKLSFLEKCYRSKWFIAFLLLLVFVTEYIAVYLVFVYTNGEHRLYCDHLVCCDSLYPYFPLCVGILVVIFSIGWAKGYFSLSGFTTYRFLSNAIGFKPLNLIFAFVFAMHLSWICDVGFELILSGNSDVVIDLIKLGIIIIGLLYIFYIFPERKKKEVIFPDSVRRILVTGLSNIANVEKGLNIEPAIKPFERYKNIDKVLILLSDSITRNCVGLTPDKLKHEALKPIVNNYKKKIDQYSEDKLDNNNIEIVKREIEIFCKACINYYYSDIDVNKIKFYFTDPVEYDNFEESYKVLEQNLIAIEKDDKETVINISPGTSVVGGVMTLNAIKGNRQLVYTKQNQNDGLLSFNPNVWTIGQLIKEFANELQADREVID